MENQPSIHSLKRKLAQLDAFIGTEIHSSIVATYKTDLLNCEANILATPPSDEASRSQALILFGQREELIRQVTFFEDTRTTLNDLILKAEDEAVKASDNQ